MKFDDIVPVVVLGAPTVIAAVVFWWGRGRERIQAGRCAAAGMALIVALLCLTIAFGNLRTEKI